MATKFGHWLTNLNLSKLVMVMITHHSNAMMLSAVKTAGLLINCQIATDTDTICIHASTAPN